MDRIDTDTKAVDLFGAGKHGFKDGNLALGVTPTDFDAEWCNAQQEEKMSVIEGAGVVPAAGVLTQLRQALRRLFGGNVTTVNAAASPFALACDHAGVVLIDATAGNVALNLPAANLLAGLQYEFRRTDSTVNTVTINRAGADVIDEADTSIVLPPKAVRRVRADGATGWPSLSASAATQAEVNAGTDDAKMVTPKTLRFGFAFSPAGYLVFPSWLGGFIIQWGGFSFLAGAATIVWPIAFPNNYFGMSGMLGGGPNADIVTASSVTLTGASVHIRAAAGGVGGDISFQYVVFGN